MARHIHSRLGRCFDRRGRFGRPGQDPGLPGREETPALAAVLAALGRPDPGESLFMLEVFLASGEHLSGRAFSQAMKERGLNLSPEQAASALELFRALGLAEKHFDEDGRALYEPNRPGGHHDHIRCGGCGRTTEFNRPEVDSLIEKIAGEEDYQHLHHQLVIRGLCPECRRRRARGLPLADTTAGEAVTVVGFEGSEDTRSRLVDLGLRRGVRLEILGEQAGSVIVSLDGCRLALGPEMAAAIMVRTGEPAPAFKSSGH
jgi:Fur family ferric uptake transcriptional regulator